MSLVLAYDFETTGLPLFDQPSDDERQPHIVQVAAILADPADNFRVRGSVNMVARPDGWIIPEDVVEAHGITTDIAVDCGFPEQFLVHVLWSFWENASVRVAHNESFDARIMRIALKRFFSGRMFPEEEGNEIEAADLWKKGVSECTARLAKPRMGIKGRRNPKLSEAYEGLVDEEFDEKRAHDAMYDTECCLEIYKRLRPQGPVEPQDAKQNGSGGTDEVPYL